jgi:hypothetical protein
VPAVTTTTASSSESSSASSGAFQAPTAAVTPLQPWDPRACAAQGGTGE